MTVQEGGDMREKYGIISMTLDQSSNVPTTNMANTSEDK